MQIYFLNSVLLFFQNNADKRFDPDPLVGLVGGSENETPEDLPILNRVKKVTDSPKSKRLFRVKRQNEFSYNTPDRFQHGEAKPAENSVSDSVQKIAESPIFRGNVENKIFRHKRDENDDSESFSSGLQYHTYGDQGTGRSAGPGTYKQLTCVLNIQGRVWGGGKLQLYPCTYLKSPQGLGFKLTLGMTIK